MHSRKLSLILYAAVFGAGAWGGPISSELYTTAYGQGIAVIFPLTQGGALSGPSGSFYFSGVETFLSGTLTNLWEGCAPAVPVGNGLNGCGTTRPAPSVYTDGANSASGSKSVISAGDTETYQGSTFSSPGGINSSGSFSANIGTSGANQSGYVNTYATNIESLTIAPDATHPAGSTGSMVLSYTILPPTVTGSATGANAFWYGEWKFRSWLSVGDTSTDQFQQGGVDLSTINTATIVQETVPFIFGTASIVSIGYDVGIGWTATGANAVTASGSFDPLESLTGISIFDAAGAPVSNFSLTDNNGNKFGANGFIAPEPSSYTLAGLGLAMLFAAVKNRGKGPGKASWPL